MKLRLTSMSSRVIVGATIALLMLICWEADAFGDSGGFFDANLSLDCERTGGDACDFAPVFGETTSFELGVDRRWSLTSPVTCHIGERWGRHIRRGHEHIQRDELHLDGYHCGGGPHRREQRRIRRLVTRRQHSGWLV